MTLHRGRLQTTIEITEIRPLTREDLVQIKDKRQVSVVSRFRDPHHNVARLIAAGLRPQEVALRSGYSLARIYTLQADPTFLELVASYRDDVNKAFVESQDDYFTMVTANALKAERQIAEKLEKAEEEGETLPTRDLIAIARDGADRIGYGKKSTTLNVNVDFAAKLEAAIQRSGKVIEGTLQSPSGPLARRA